MDAVVVQITIHLERVLDVCLCSQVCSFINGASVHWITEQAVPYATNGIVWLGYDNVQSVAAKVN